MRILCIGDSNTWGYVPGLGTRHENRWTRILSRRRPDWEIIEEGYSGRTLIAPDYEQRQRCGIENLKMLLMSHRPVDCVVLMLGTNDLKSCYGFTVQNLARGMQEYLRIILNPYQWEGFAVPRVLVVSPIHIGEQRIRQEGPYGVFNENSVAQSRALAGALKSVCDAYGVDFMDAADHAGPSGVDCIHMDEENHRALARGIEEKLCSMLE